MSLQAKQLLKEQARRDRFLNAVKASSKGLFDKQRAVYDSKAKRICMRAGRRSGKTSTALPVALRAAARFPGAIIPVCERTLTCAAAMAFWKALQAFDAEHQLGVEFRHTVKEALLPNGSRIQLFGVDTLELADKLRGEPYPVAIIDEAGTFRSHVLEYLCDEVLKLSLMDYDGVMILVGTPGPRKDPRSFWYRVCYNAALDEDGSLQMGVLNWEQHHWTVLENTEFGKLAYQRSLEWRQKKLKEEILEAGWLLPRERWEDASPVDVIAACLHPKFRREVMGEWCDAFVDRFFEFDPERNTVDRLPSTDLKHPWRYGLGIDLGFNDPTAFVVTASRKGDPNVYVVESMAKEGMIPSAIATQINRYEMVYGRFHFVVADTGGAGKLAVEEMNQKYGLSILPATKTGKMVFREHINGDFRVGRVQLVASMNVDLSSDLWTLRLNEKETDTHPDDPDHLPDALVYAHRQWIMWNTTQLDEAEREGKPLIPGSQEWYAKEDARMEELGDWLAEQDRQAGRRFDDVDPDYGDDPDFDAYYDD